MLRKHFVKKNISTQAVEYIIGHNGSIYLSITLRVLVLLFLVYLIFWLLTVKAGVNFPHIEWIFGGLGIILLGKYVVDFLNLYLDGIALSEEGMTLVLWEGLLQYKTEYFDRERISTINHEQNGIWDKIFYRGNIVICLEHGIDFPFENVTAPKKQVDKIMQLKERFQKQKGFDPMPELNNMEDGDDKMKIFIEAFGEVMKEFMEKKESSD